MTDYNKAMRRPPMKRAAIWLLEKPLINALVVGVLRGMKHAKWRHRIPVVLNHSRLALPGDNAIEMLNPARCNVARELFWNDGQLVDGADRNALELAIALSRDADHFLDIGSYTGLFALSVARCNPSIRCHAFEIIPANFLLLWQNIIHNDLVSRTIVYFKGVGSTAGVIRVPRTLEAGVLPSSVALDSAVPDGIEVSVDSVDQLIDAREGKVVIKIDVEGFEWSVFDGARGLIERTRPDVICEFLTRAPDIPKIIDYLEPLVFTT